MYKLSEAKTRRLIQVCNMYYIEGLNQQEIAKKIDVSRSQVSRMLTTAKENGLVNISIKNPFADEQKYEKWFIETFGLLDALVIDAPEDEPRELKRKFSAAITDLLDYSLRDGNSLGVMAGKSVNFISREIGELNKKDLTVIPMVGGVGVEGNWQANLTAHNFSQRLNCRYMQLNAPFLVGTVQVRNELLKEPSIAGVLEAAKNCQVALIGLGQISSDATILNTDSGSKIELGELKKKGAVTSICNSFLDRRGRCIDVSFQDRMIGLAAGDLRNIPKVIAIAFGEHKTEAITAALKGRWVDVFVTNLDTAKKLRQSYLYELRDQLE